jgi:hypothetical protein
MTNEDAGVRVLRGIFETLMIDREWAICGERGFFWLGWRLAQVVQASESFEDGGMIVSRVMATVDVVRNIHADGNEIARQVLLLNRLAAGSAWMYAEDTRTLMLGFAMTVHDGTAAFRSQQLADYTILQLIDAESRADELAKLLKGEVAIFEHPQKGVRERPDEMLGLSKLIAERSGDRSIFADRAEMETVSDFARGSQGLAFSAGGGPGGVCLEVPFGANDTALIELKTFEPHPDLGNGLLVLSRIRGAMQLSEAVAMADRLNEIAFAPQSVLPLLGAWSVWNSGDAWSLAFGTFIPNFMAQPGVARDAASSAVFRLTLVDQLWHPELGPRNVLEILARRMSMTEERGLHTEQ